jgi:hypothetical protein
MVDAINNTGLCATPKNSFPACDEARYAPNSVLTNQMLSSSTCVHTYPAGLQPTGTASHMTAASPERPGPTAARSLMSEDTFPAPRCSGKMLAP